LIIDSLAGGFVIGKLRAISDDKKRLFSNFFSLSVLQGANYLLPLITLPYLVRVLGPEKFGLVAFAQAFIQYFVILTDYGFNLSATKEISIHRENRQKVSEIFTSVLTIKFVLMVLSLILLCAVVFSFSKFKSDWQIYFLTFGMVIGQVLFPVWLFQGMERMKYIAFLNILAKTIFTVAVFIFIKHSSDYFYVPLINSVGFLVSGVLALRIAKKNFGIGINTSGITARGMYTYLKEGFSVFSSLVSSTLLYRSPTVFIGVLLNYSMVGFYSAAEKIVSALKGIILIFNQTVYPRLSKLVVESKYRYFKAWYRCLWVGLALSTLLFICLSIFAEKLIITLFTAEYEYSIFILKFLSISLIFCSIINWLGLLGMLVQGYAKQLAYSQIGPVLLFIALSLFALKYCNLPVYIGFFLFTEILIIFYRLCFLHKKGVFKEAFKVLANG